LPNHFYGHIYDLQISEDQNQEMKQNLTVKSILFQTDQLNVFIFLLYYIFLNSRHYYKKDKMIKIQRLLLAASHVKFMVNKGQCVVASLTSHSYGKK